MGRDLRLALGTSITSDQSCQRRDLPGGRASILSSGAEQRHAETLASTASARTSARCWNENRSRTTADTDLTSLCTRG